MAEIIKTEAIVLKKFDYGDTSRIASLFTKEFGKISVILKGAKSPKSKIGVLVDTFNILQIVYYNKPERDIQVLTQVDLIKHHKNLPESLDKIKYASAVIELISKLTIEEEPHSKVFEGTRRILEIFNSILSSENFYFLKYFYFFIKEIGYELHLKNCSLCNVELPNNNSVFYNCEEEFFCSNCAKERLTNKKFSLELFNFLRSLSSKKNDITVSGSEIASLISFLEAFMKYQLHEFTGLKSLQL